jgi:glycerol-3-phosphate acyltransferase PlsY
MDRVATSVLLVAAAYVAGAIPFGYLCARLVKGIDIREHGSRNIGATNVARVCGRPWGVLVFVLDFLKGAGPVLFAFPLLLKDAWGEPATPDEARAWWTIAGCGVAAIVGHMFPITLRFRGGKGVATATGVFIVLAPAAVGIALATWLLFAALFRFVSLASIAAAVALAAAQAAFGGDGAWGARLPVTLLTGVAAILVIVRHASNIKRLIAGTERKIGGGRNQSESLTGDPRGDSRESGNR